MVMFHSDSNIFMIWKSQEEQHILMIIFLFLHQKTIGVFILPEWISMNTPKPCLVSECSDIYSAGVGIARSHKQAAYDYNYQNSQDDPHILTDSHTFGKIIAGIRFAWGEKFIRNSVKQASLGTKYPGFPFSVHGKPGRIS